MKQATNPQRIFRLQYIACLALLLAVLVVDARAQTDTDVDGFANEARITFFNGTFLDACGQGSVRSQCVDASSPDVFVILVPATGGRFANLADPLAVIRNLNRNANTPTGAHPLTPAQANAQKQVTSSSTQKAIRVTENLGLKSAGTNPDGVWGSSIKQGTPNLFGGGEAKVYTSQIAADITAYYAPQAVPAGLIDDCIKHTIAHEAGHNMAVAAQPDKTLTGSHYSTTQQVVMSQAPLFTRVGTTVSISCPTTYATPDFAGFRLK